MRFIRRLRRNIPVWFELLVLGGVILVLVTVGVSVLWATVAPLPSITSFENRRIAESTKIYDRTGNVVLYDVHGSIRRTSIPFEEISPYIQNATIAVEDTAFYEHNGFRPSAFLRAVLVNLGLRSGFAGQGGSTITQQVVKNALLTTDKTLVRKAKEIVLALRLERVYTKEEILTTYLNETSYGGTLYGVEEASQYFYGKSAADVTLAEASYLASLPQAPTRLSPYRVDPETGRNERLEARQDLVLARMLEADFISQEEYDTAIVEEVEFRDEAEAGIKAPHFVFFVREYLEDKYGADVVAQGGLKVITTLDYDLQQAAEEIVARNALRNETTFNAENAGLVAIEPASGQILTMVGSRGYFDDDIDGKVNIAVANRQPGSAFKPFVYATAFEKGYTPETVVFDVKTQFSTACPPDDFSNEMPCYSPENYDHEFRGPITFRNALAQSVNIPAVKAVWLAGVNASIETATRMGISTLTDAARYGLTLVLGGGEVTLLDMVSAYSVFANDGVRNPPVAILRVEDKSGKILESYKAEEARVLDAQIARQISDVLSDNVARTPLYGANSSLYFGGLDVAAKTGTTNENRDAWILGYSTSIAAGAWAGNNIPEPMNQISGLIVTPMWREFMDMALAKYTPGSFTPPAPVPDFENLSPILRGEWSVNPTEGAHAILYWVDRNNPRAGKPTNPWSDAQFARWEYSVSLWAGQQPPGALSGGIVPGAGSSDFTILIPLPNSTLSGSASIPVSVAYPNNTNVTRVSYMLNGQPVGLSESPPFYHSFGTAVRGNATLTAIFETNTGPVERSAQFTIQ